MLEAPAFAEPTIIGNGDVRTVIYGSDAGAIVEFFASNIYQEAESLSTGQEIFKRVDMISFRFPGDKNKNPVRAVRNTWFGDVPPDTERFPRQWAAYKQGQQLMDAGSSLVDWTHVNAAQVRELNAMGIYTVEMLSEVTDANLEGLGHGARALREQAKSWLVKKADEVSNATLADQNADLQRQLDELRASFAAEQPRRGRPPKDKETEE